MRMHHVVICGLPSPPPNKIFSPYLIKEIKKLKIYWARIVFFEFLYYFCLKHFSFLEELSEM
jgi:hypothetical protein